VLLFDELGQRQGNKLSNLKVVDFDEQQTLDSCGYESD